MATVEGFCYIYRASKFRVHLHVPPCFQLASVCINLLSLELYCAMGCEFSYCSGASFSVVVV